MKSFSFRVITDNANEDMWARFRQYHYGIAKK